MRRLTLFGAAFVPAFNVLLTGQASAQIVTIPPPEVSSWGSLGPCPIVTKHTALARCEIDGPFPEAYGWLAANDSDVATFMAFTVVTVYNKAASTYRITTVYNEPPNGFTMPDTNSEGTRIWTLTYTRSDIPLTTVVTYPTPFVNWPEYYLWDGYMSFTQAGGNATTHCVHHEATATPRYLTATPAVTDVELFNRTGYLADPYGLNHGLEFTSRWREPYFWYGSLFPGEPPLTQCVDAAVLPDGRGGRWTGKWFVETTTSVSYEDETTTTTTTDSEEAVTTSSESDRVINQLPATSTDSPPPSTSTRWDDKIPTSTEAPRPSIPTTTTRQEDGVPTLTRPYDGVTTSTRQDDGAPTTTTVRVEPSSTSDSPGPASSDSSGPGTESQTRTASKTRVASEATVISQTSLSHTTAASQSKMKAQSSWISESPANSDTTATQRIKVISTDQADATTAVVNDHRTKPLVLIPVVRATLVTTAEDGSVETVLAFVPDEEAMSSTSVDRMAKNLKPGAYVHGSLVVEAAEETSVVQSTSGNAEESTATPVATLRGWSIARPRPGSSNPDGSDPESSGPESPNPVPNLQTAGGVWHRPDRVLMVVLAMAIAFM